MVSLHGYRARIAHPLDRERLESFDDGLLVVDAGKVAWVGDAASHDGRAWRARCAAVDELGEKLIVPGLVDTHVHLPQMPAMGLRGETLLDWLEHTIYPLESGFADPERARAVARRFFAELVANGTTTAAVYVTVHRAATEVAFEEAERAGVRAILGKVMMDRACPDALREDPAVSVRESVELHERWDGAADGLLRYAFTPRFLLSCSPELLRGAAEAAIARDAYVQTHLAEMPEEVALVRAQHPDRSYAQAYDDAGLLGARTILAHCIHLEDGDPALLAERRAAVAFCPSSNLFLRSGTMDLQRLLEHGVEVGVGSDCGAGPSLSLFQTLRDGLHQLGAALDPRAALYHATLGGARALALDDVTGNLEPGKDADFLVLDWRRAAPYEELPADAIDDLLSLLCYRGDDRAVEATFVRGRRLG